MRAQSGSFLLFLSFAFLVFSSPAAGQEYTFGLKIGLSTTTLTGDSDTDLTWRNAFSGGVTAGATFMNVITVQPEIVYVVKGASTDNIFQGGQPTGLEGVFSFSYVDLPLLVYYSPLQQGKIYPKVFAGPHYSVQLEASVEQIDPNTGGSQSEAIDTIRGSDYGFTVGAGFDFDFRGERITFDTRYMFGQSNIRPNVPDAPLHNRGLLFLVGVSF